ncbi:hypothetical protein [Flavisolibacter tropicus]|uniref:Lipoprotein n=1 Tax=Flavisolibacter tropicus TaxID=1492898 RepID=A0A172U2F8_9BACT|nr:hypothetical protein [Flavisolibacter tropicus]ANE53348.1 hypothetical protein SY85_06360 [Flavisolibacter tropicus]
MKGLLVFLGFIVIGCSSAPKLVLQKTTSDRKAGTILFKEGAANDWRKRDSMVIAEISKGNMPSFLQQLTPVHLQLFDTASQKTIKAIIYVTPDYLSVGTNTDWVRVCLTPITAQKLADQFHCFLPTRKLVDAIYAAAKVKLEPVPMFAFRDSTPTMYQHHLIIEGQRKGQKGLIGGIKKDIVTTGKLVKENRLDKVAIYGWHQLNGKPIQPLYTGHANWYTDYSHGTRLVYNKIKVNGRWYDYKDVWQHPVWRKLVCDEEYCDLYKYPY